MVLQAALATRSPAPVDGILAPAELAVLQLLSEGATPKHVAVERGCSLYTVRKHILRIARKLECNGYRQAVRVARERGYVRQTGR